MRIRLHFHDMSTYNETAEAISSCSNVFYNYPCEVSSLFHQFGFFINPNIQMTSAILIQLHWKELRWTWLILNGDYCFLHSDMQLMIHFNSMLDKQNVKSWSGFNGCDLFSRKLHETFPILQSFVTFVRAEIRALKCPPWQHSRMIRAIKKRDLECTKLCNCGSWCLQVSSGMEWI